MHSTDNPYDILGVSSSASEEEITRAYRRLAKKYHPDLNAGSKTAEQNMRRVNAAYEQIKSQKGGGASYERPDGSYGTQRDYQQSGGYTYRGDDPFGGFDFGDIFGDLFGQSWQRQDGGQERAPSIQQVRLYIQMRQYQNALHMLSRIQQRDAEWYYLSAVAHAGVGNRVMALNHAQEAVRLDPSNAEYQRLLNRIQQGGQEYRQAGQQQGFNMQGMGGSLLMCALAQMACCFCCR